MCNFFESENILHEKEDFDESGELTEDLDKVLQLEFENGIATYVMFQIPYPEKNSTININDTIKNKGYYKTSRKISPEKRHFIRLC